MNDQAFFEWLVFGYLMLLGIRYLLGARVYLMCALREAEFRAAKPEEFDPEELQLISLFDEDLATAGFRHLGFGLISPIITYYESASAASIFANEALPAYAIVQRRVAPEYGGLAHLEVITEFSAGPALVTQNTAYGRAFLPAGISVEALREGSVSGVVGRHADRVTQAARSRVPVKPDSLQHILEAYCGRLASLRALYRRRRWVMATTDRLLDRFTLRGALTLAHHSMRYFGKPASFARRRAEAVPEALRALRVQADFKAVKHIAYTAQPAPGTPWTLITAMAITALASFAAMATLWGAFTASVILGVIAFHEAGHVVAMRAVGYRDIHVLFVPLLGALTVGRPAKTTALQRVAVLLAGPVPGLCLGVLLLEINRIALAIPDLKMVALALLLINGLNLLPITPFDGGRALESLTRPGSLWRPAIHVMSIIGLLAAAYHLQDPVLAMIGVAWGLMLPRQVLGWRLRRSLASAVHDPQGNDQVIRGALQCMTEPRFSSWRSATRQATARALAREFSDTVTTTPSDRRWAALAYAFAWIPAVAGAILWWR